MSPLSGRTVYFDLKDENENCTILMGIISTLEYCRTNLDRFNGTLTTQISAGIPRVALIDLTRHLDFRSLGKYSYSFMTILEPSLNSQLFEIIFNRMSYLEMVTKNNFWQGKAL